jgi:hypothetical protein
LPDRKENSQKKKKTNTLGSSDCPRPENLFSHLNNHVKFRSKFSPTTPSPRSSFRTGWFMAFVINRAIGGSYVTYAQDLRTALAAKGHAF